MLVSTRGRYALRVMVELARRGQNEPVALSSIAAEQNISEKYLENILSTLTKAGLIDGRRGKGGGYRLTRAPGEYSVGEVLRLTEGTLSPVACIEDGECTCDRADDCSTRPLWTHLDRLIGGFLDGVTLEELAHYEEG